MVAAFEGNWETNALQVEEAHIIVIACCDKEQDLLVIGWSTASSLAAA